MNVSKVKISEIAKITGTSNALISRHFKEHDDTHLTRKNNRVIGINPEAVEHYLKSVGLDYFYQPSIFLAANCCGGVGKTSSIYNLGASARRLSGRDTPIVYVDTDPQGSFTSLVFKKPAEDGELILIDYLEGKVSIDEIMVQINENVWFVKSNLNNIWIDKILNKPQAIKKCMLKFYEDIFYKFGNNAKIFQDHNPNLPSVFASSVCAAMQMSDEYVKSILIPIRSDSFAIHGAKAILKEINELIDTFSLDKNIDIHCFFSSIDKRVSTTAEAIKLASTEQNIMKYLSSVVIRYCSEIPKGIMKSQSVYHNGKNNNAAEDYQDLLQYIYSYKRN